MTAPLSDERLAEILVHAPNCRYGCVACESAPGLVAEIRRLRTERDEANEKLAAATRTVAAVAEVRDQALALLDRGVDDEPCEVDQHGLCQAHWLSSTPCRNAEARRLLGLGGAP